MALARKLTDKKVWWIMQEVKKCTHPDEIAWFARVTPR